MLPIFLSNVLSIILQIVTEISLNLKRDGSIVHWKNTRDTLQYNQNIEIQKVKKDQGIGAYKAFKRMGWVIQSIGDWARTRPAD